MRNVYERDEHGEVALNDQGKRKSSGKEMDPMPWEVVVVEENGSVVITREIDGDRYEKTVRPEGLTRLIERGDPSLEAANAAKNIVEKKGGGGEHPFKREEAEEELGELAAERASEALTPLEKFNRMLEGLSESDQNNLTEYARQSALKADAQKNDDGEGSIYHGQRAGQASLKLSPGAKAIMGRVSGYYKQAHG
jgi:hypothetical protein